MARYQQKPKVAPKVVWVVNPDERVIDCTSDMEAAKYAMRNRGGWRLATPDQIEAAIAERESRNAAAEAAQERMRAARKVASEMARAGSELVKEEGGAPAPRSRTARGDDK